MIVETDAKVIKTDNKVEVLYENGNRVIYDPQNIERLVLNERDVTAILFLKDAK